MEETHFFLCANPFPAKVVKQNIFKFKRHNFTGVYPNPVLMKLGARKCIILSCWFIKLKDNVVFYDGPNGSLFISILLHNAEFRILNSEFQNLHCEFRNSEL